MPSVSIVIRALNEAAHLPALYSGLLRQTRQPDQVILVDSGSTDDSVAISRAHGAEIVHIKPDEFSFGRALNLGCSHATGDVLVFVSAHVYPLDEKWLDRMITPFERPDVGLVYGGQTGDSRSHFSELELLRTWFPDVSDDDQETPFCNNANCAVRAAAWRDLPYDESLTGLEDLDWAKRAHEAGWKLVYQADARIAHIHNEPFAVTRNRYRREAIAHRRIFHDQDINLFEAAGLFVLSVGRDYLAAIARRCLVSNLTSIPRFRAAQYLGTWEGFRDRGDISHSLRRRFYYPKGFTGLNRTQRESPRRPSTPKDERA
jgi:rhamnosyltransferase